MFDISKFKGKKQNRNEYKEQLTRIQKKGQTTECIEKAVNGAVENIRENQARSFVIYGEPQSGKTEMMICLVAKLLDEGNKIIIMLINDHVELLNQNFRRFSVAGISAQLKTYDQIMDRSIKIENSNWVIFCKKNSKNLQNLIDKIGNKTNKIIIDDEADYATPDANINKEKEATAINRYVGKLLDEHSFYIGVTATPARLDLNNTYENDNENWVHFPPHRAYTGQDVFFPTESKISAIDFNLKKLPEDSDIPKYLREAFFSFLVNVAYLNTENDSDDRNFSMLVHTSAKVDDHNEDKKTIVNITQALEDENSEKYEKYIKDIWNTASERYPGKADTIVHYIIDNASRITPIIMNNKSQDDPNFATDPVSPFTVIFGGNKISRGVTFPNLLSMFFARDAKHKLQQDTYIQRARMFGARKDILKYFELHIPKTLYEDWWRCFLFHRLSWSAIKEGGSPVWFADKRIAAASAASIKQSIVSVDKGEISFEVFRFTPEIQYLWSGKMDAFDKLLALQKVLYEQKSQAVPRYLIDFIEKSSHSRSNIYAHQAVNISNRKTMDDTRNIVRKKGLFGGSEINNHPECDHHLGIFFNDNGNARLVYRYTGGVVSFLTVKNKR